MKLEASRYHYWCQILGTILGIGKVNMLKSKINMVVSGIHLMRADIKKLTEALRSQNAPADRIIQFTEMDKRLLKLLGFAKQSFAADDSLASQNYLQLILEFRKELALLNEWNRICIEQYSSIEDATESVSLHLQDLNLDFGDAAFDNL